MEKNNKKQNAVIIFLVVIILVLVGLFAMFYLKNEDNKTNDKTKVNESVKEQQDNNKKEVISKDKYDEYEKFLKKYSNIQSCYDIFDSYNYEKNTIDNNYLVEMSFKNTEKLVEIDTSNISKSEKEITDEYVNGKSYEDLQNTINAMFYKKYTLKKANNNFLRYIASDDAFVDIADLGRGYGCASGPGISRVVFNIEKDGNKLEFSVVSSQRDSDGTNTTLEDKNNKIITTYFDEKTNKYTIEGKVYNSDKEFVEKYKERFEQVKVVFILDGPTYKLSHLEKIN